MRKAIKDKGNYFFENTSKESTPGDLKKQHKNKEKYKENSDCVHMCISMYSYISNNCNSVEN